MVVAQNRHTVQQNKVEELNMSTFNYSHLILDTFYVLILILLNISKVQNSVTSSIRFYAFYIKGTAKIPGNIFISTNTHLFKPVPPISHNNKTAY